MFIQTEATPNPEVLKFLPGREVLAEAGIDPAARSLRLPALSLDAAPVRFEFHYTATGPVVLHNIRLVPSTLQLRPPS